MPISRGLLGTGYLFRLDSAETRVQNEIVNRVEKAVGPLTLVPETAEQLNLYREQIKPVILPERPTTPINEEVRSAPKELLQLKHLVRRRLRIDTQHPVLDLEQRQALASVLFGEITGVWQEIRNQSDDPFLTQKQNKELRRRLVVHVVCLCEFLFDHYLQKAHELKKKQIFSHGANFSRLVTQLAEDANKFLNILIIRRHLVADIRRLERIADSPQTTHFYAVQPQPSTSTSTTEIEQKLPKLSFANMIAKSRPKSVQLRPQYIMVDEEVKDMNDSMPELNMKRVQAVLESLPLPGARFIEELPPKETDKQSRLRPLDDSQRCDSMPELRQETLLDEIESQRSTIKLSKDKANLTPWKRRASMLVLLRDPIEHSKKTMPASANEDLQQLIESGGTDKFPPLLHREQGADELEDLPPLLKALVRYSDSATKKRQEVETEHSRILAQAAKLEEEPCQKSNELNSDRPSTNILPDTFVAKANNMLLRPSRSRVSDRVCISSMCLKKFAPIYNHLMAEIDDKTVKHLDRKLHMRDEIKEVYSEMIKTVPKDHLKLDQDPLLESAPLDSYNLDLSKLHSSSRLFFKKTERVVNDELCNSDSTSPWETGKRSEWRKMPLPLLLPMGPEAIDSSMTSVDRYINQFMALKSHEGQTAVEWQNAQENLGGLLYNSKMYAAWITWWRNMMSTDDYLKYVSHRGSDYLAVMFHLFESATAEELWEQQMQEEAANAELRAKQSEKDEQLRHLTDQKTKFEKRMWNVNSVLLGGLGCTPEHMDESHPKNVTTESKSDDGQSNSRSLLLRIRAATAENQSREQEPTEMQLSEEELLEEMPIQSRLDRIWVKLKVPDKQRLDMAIKYSASNYSGKLMQAVRTWERAADIVTEREVLLAKLEEFERHASDPNRFFQQGSISTVTRLNEARKRSVFMKKFDDVDSRLVSVLEYAEAIFKDTVSFQGRCYKDKMKTDRVEMLYWLQEERKQSAIDYRFLQNKESRSIVNPQTVTAKHLPPISIP